MKKYLILGLAILLLFLIQSAVLSPLNILPINLPLILIVISLLFASFNFALGLTLTCGIISDFLSSAPDGLITISLLFVFFIMVLVINNVLTREPSLLILFSSVAAATIGYFIFFALFNQIFKIFHFVVLIDLRNYWLISLPKSILFNLLLTYPILIYYRFINDTKSV